MIDRGKFFDTVRPMFDGDKLSTLQVQGMENVLDEWEKRALTDLRWLSYMFATDFHETDQTMQPIREKGSEAYLRSKPYYPWVGEGLVQTTWETNHRKFGATAPGQLLKWPDCLVPLFDGMIKGEFTGVKLATYFNANLTDPVQARKIINGLDKAKLVATYYATFLKALQA